MENQTPSMQEVTWDEVRLEVKAVNAKLFGIIEQISPNRSFKIIRVRYNYGDKITDLGTICLPNSKGELVRLDQSDISKKIREQLDYCPTPLILQLYNGAEVFISTKDRILPLNVFTPGDLYGLYEAIMPLTNCSIAPCWSVTAGARSVFMAAKITDAANHKRLRNEFGLSHTSPQHLLDHWAIFKEINARTMSAKPWYSEVLIFTKNWFKNRIDDIHWLRFQYYLLVQSWIQSKNTRTKLEFDSTIWEKFASVICSKNLKPNPYILDTIRHLYVIGQGAGVGFCVYNDRKELCPIEVIEDAYENIYKLKDYPPMILGPWLFVKDPDNHRLPLYYSISYPTLVDGTPSTRRKAKLIVELREVKDLMTIFNQTLQREGQGRFCLNNKIEYFHSENSSQSGLLNNQSIIEWDSTFQAYFQKQTRNKKFPIYSPFFRCCIRVMP